MVGHIAALAGIAHALTIGSTAITIAQARHAAIGAIGAQTQGRRPSAAAVIGRITDSAHLGHTLTGGPITIVIAPTPNTAGLSAITHAERCIAAAARTIYGITGQTTLVHTLAGGWIGTIKIPPATHALIAVGPRITNGGVSSTSAVGAQLADRALARHALSGRTITVIIIAACCTQHPAR